MTTYDKKKIDGPFWMFCAPCESYAYTPKDARTHQMMIHACKDDYVNQWWPDG